MRKFFVWLEDKIENTIPGVALAAISFAGLMIAWIMLSLVTHGVALVLPLLVVVLWYLLSEE